MLGAMLGNAARWGIRATSNTEEKVQEVKRRVLVWCAVLVLAGVVVWSYAVPFDTKTSLLEKPRQVVRNAVVGEPKAKQYVQWAGPTVRPHREKSGMAKTQVPSTAFSGSCNICIMLVPGDDQYGVAAIYIVTDVGRVIIAPDISAMPTPRFNITLGVPHMWGGPIGSISFPIPTEPTLVKIPFEFGVTNAYLTTDHSTSIIGDKANATHGKEQNCTDQWVVPDDAALHLSCGGVTYDGGFTGPGDPVPIGLSMSYSGSFDPDIEVTTITENDQFLLVACDGLFDVFTGEDIVHFVRTNMLEHGDAQRCCQNLTQEAILKRHSRDNVSVILIILNRWY